MKSLVINRTESALDSVIGKNGLIGIFAGLLFTIMVQSSSITTSLLIPLIGAGLITVETIFPITMGANIGTTATAILASFATGNPAAITIAFVHFLFNMTGVVFIYPIRIMRSIPINLAKNVVKQLKEKGKVVRGWLGVVVQTVTPELADSFGLKDRKGALVADVEEGAPADEAGIKKGDIIIAFDGKEIEEMSELPLVVAQTQVGKKVDVTILRNGKELTKKAMIGELKEDEAYALSGAKSRTDIGMEVNELTRELARKYGISETKGVLVTYVENDSPAERAGIREGDIIIEVNREAVKNLDEYYKATKQAKKGDKILFWIKRGRSSQFVVVQLEEE